MASALRQRRRGESANSPSPGIFFSYLITLLLSHTSFLMFLPSLTPKTEGYAGKMPLYALGVNNRGFAVAGGGGGVSYMHLSYSLSISLPLYSSSKPFLSPRSLLLLPFQNEFDCG